MRPIDRLSKSSLYEKRCNSTILNYQVILELYPFKFDQKRNNTLNDYKRNITNNLAKYESFPSHIL